MDKNLKYAIIEELMEKNIFSFELEEFLELNPDVEYDEFEPCEEIERYFRELELNNLDLSQVTELKWYPGGPEVIEAICLEWDGEDDYFDIRSLDGIGICENITKISIEYLLAAKNLSPLTELKKLESIRLIIGRAKIEDLSPLLEIGSLREVTIQDIGNNVLVTKEAKEVIRKLISKGVIINLGE